jgi:methyl-accepting chemotaxis protein
VKTFRFSGASFMTSENPNQSEASPPSAGGAAEKPEPKAAVLATDAVLERFTRSFEASARRWEFIVYPSLFGFTLLAAYGFFLIFSLTRDMATLAQHVDPQMASNMGTMADRITVLSENVESMSQNVAQLTESIDIMNGYIATISGHTEDMSVSTASMSQKLNALDPIQFNMAAMNESMRVMTANTTGMTRDMSHMNYSIGRPMNFFNSFFPW